MLTISQLQERAYATAKSKGWHDDPLREGDVIHHARVLEKHALMHTELTEVRQAFREGKRAMYEGANGKPEGAIVEIADFVIRVCDTTAALDLPLYYDLHSHVERLAAGHFTGDAIHFAERLENIREQVDLATEYARIDAWDLFYLDEPSDAHYVFATGRALAEATRLGFCIGEGLRFRTAIEGKMRYNETRPYRHGGKRA